MIGLFGGTFNPVHWGHVRTAAQLQKTLGMERVIMVPAGIPPHRDLPDVDAQTRLEMVEAAVKAQLAMEPGRIEVDDRELRRSGPSYTVDTLKAYREQFPQQSIAFIVGADAFLQLHTWHEWQKIFEYAHLIVVHRPGWSLEKVDELLPDVLRPVVVARSVTDPGLLQKQLAGLLLCLNVTEINISSSEIRKKIASGESVEKWVPESVVNIIESRKLYKNR